MGYKKISMVNKNILEEPGGAILITKAELQRLYRVIREKEQELVQLRAENLKLNYYLCRSKPDNSSIKF